MPSRIPNLSNIARQAIAGNNLPLLFDAYNKIIQIDSESAEGYFLKGVWQKQRSDLEKAQATFSHVLTLDKKRYDAAIELANLYWHSQMHSKAAKLLNTYTSMLGNSPHYLSFAGTLYSNLGLHEKAYPLFEAANKLQPNIPSIESSLASSASKFGKLDLAEKYYKKLLRKQPLHQRNHFELARLHTATNNAHIRQMKSILNKSGGSDADNIFLFFALAKELEDLGQWEASFEYVKRGNDAACHMATKANYHVSQDINLLNEIKATCNEKWLSETVKDVALDAKPIFIVGLPRTGTTLVDRILSSHSQVESIDETFMLEMAIKTITGTNITSEITEKNISQAAELDAQKILATYLETIKYKLSGEDYFIEKYPLNFMYLGFILKALPNAKVIILDRKPLDACFAMYKQPYFRFSYDLEWLAHYYIAYNKLREHWSSVFGDRLISVQYEDLASEPNQNIRNLLAKADLDFEQSCIDFHLTSGSSASASFAQIRQKTHTGSINKWANWESQLLPLVQIFNEHGIDTAKY